MSFQLLSTGYTAFPISVVIKRLYRISYFSCYQKVIPHFGATNQMPLFIPPKSMITCIGATNQMPLFIPPKSMITCIGATSQMPVFIPPESMITCIGATNQMHWFILSGGHVQMACFLLFRRIFIILYHHCES